MATGSQLGVAMSSCEGLGKRLRDIESGATGSGSAIFGVKAVGVHQIPVNTIFEIDPDIRFFITPGRLTSYNGSLIVLAGGFHKTEKDCITRIEAV